MPANASSAWISSSVMTRPSSFHSDAPASLRTRADRVPSTCRVESRFQTGLDLLAAGRGAGSRRPGAAGRHRPGFGARRSGRRTGDRCRDIRPGRRPRLRLAVEHQRRAAVFEPQLRARRRYRPRSSIPRLRSGASRGWRSAARRPPGWRSRLRRRSAFAHSPGTLRSADCTNRPPGKILVAIEKALMPGSNTPNPPGSQIHCWPGCHLWTSSCQRIVHRLRCACRRAPSRRHRPSDDAARARW